MGRRTADWEEAWLADAASPNPFLNAVTLTRPLGEDEADALTTRLEAYFAEVPAGGPWLLWSGWPTPTVRNSLQRSTLQWVSTSARKVPPKLLWPSVLRS